MSARVILTTGEPAGVGPDLLVRFAQRRRSAPWAVVSDPALLRERAARLGLPVEITLLDGDAPPPAPDAGQIPVIPQTLPETATPGRLDTANARWVIEHLGRATDLCASGPFNALVTPPLHKGVVNDAGIAFSGHTEFLAERTGAPCPVMLLASPDMRVALASTHLPIARVAGALTSERLEQVLRVLHDGLARQFGLPAPRIAVCGLNPHAGEGGHMGSEEIDILIPLLDRLRAEGMALTGPVPADTAFTPHALEHCDVVLAMYHDQGLPVIKHSGFGRIVNVTLGLPIVRTSVAHGTALELAGTDQADVSSLESAFELAASLAANAA